MDDMHDHIHEIPFDLQHQSEYEYFPQVDQINIFSLNLSHLPDSGPTCHNTSQSTLSRQISSHSSSTVSAHSTPTSTPHLCPGIASQIITVTPTKPLIANESAVKRKKDCQLGEDLETFPNDLFSRTKWAQIDSENEIHRSRLRLRLDLSLSNHPKNYPPSSHQTANLSQSLQFRNISAISNINSVIIDPNSQDSRYSQTFFREFPHNGLNNEYSPKDVHNYPGYAESNPFGPQDEVSIMNPDHLVSGAVPIAQALPLSQNNSNISSCPVIVSAIMNVKVHHTNSRMGDEIDTYSSVDPNNSTNSANLSRQRIIPPLTATLVPIIPHQPVLIVSSIIKHTPHRQQGVAMCDETQRSANVPSLQHIPSAIIGKK